MYGCFVWDVYVRMLCLGAECIYIWNDVFVCASVCLYMYVHVYFSMLNACIYMSLWVCFFICESMYRDMHSSPLIDFFRSYTHTHTHTHYSEVNICFTEASRPLKWDDILKGMVFYGLCLYCIVWT